MSNGKINFKKTPTVNDSTYIFAKLATTEKFVMLGINQSSRY